MCQCQILIKFEFRVTNISIFTVKRQKVMIYYNKREKRKHILCKVDTFIDPLRI